MRDPEAEAALERLDSVRLQVVEFVTLGEFIAQPVPQAEPIVVDATGATVFAADGLGLCFGDGGAGKTTLWLDAALHFTAGEDWPDELLRPTRPLRVGWVENEGPQEEFRRKLERKLQAFGDRVPADAFHVLRVPWGALDLRLPEHRAGLAAAVGELNLDLLIIGPLNDLGMEGGGTPDEVRAFHGYLKDVQAQAERLVSLMVLHHENAAGRVSGAWTGRPDLLVHVTQKGHGKTGVYWQKAKWSSALHRTTTHLRWTEGEGFEREEEEAPRPERTWDGIAEYVLVHGGTTWGPVLKAVRARPEYLAQRRDQMLADGVILNAGRGRGYSLWHRDDPERPTLDADLSEAGKGRENGLSDPGGGERNETLSPFPLRSRERERERVGSTPPVRAELQTKQDDGRGT